MLKEESNKTVEKIIMRQQALRGQLETLEKELMNKYEIQARALTRKYNEQMAKLSHKLEQEYITQKESLNKQLYDLENERLYFEEKE